MYSHVEIVTPDTIFVNGGIDRRLRGAILTEAIMLAISNALVKFQYQKK